MKNVINIMTTNKCFRCGFEIAENANFCSNCGVALKDPMPEIVYIKTDDEQPIEIIEEEIENIETPEVSNIEVSENEDIVIEPSAEGVNNVESKEEEVKENNSEEVVEDNTSEKGRKILWIPEWAFCSALLILGVIAIVAYKFINDPEWNKLIPDMSNLFATSEIVATEDTVVHSKSIDTINTITAETNIEADVKIEPQPTLEAKGDSTYHVVVMTLKSIESAEKIVASGKYTNAYIISDSTLNRIAVYNNVDKVKAKHFLDSIANNGCPGAWIFHGKAK